MADPSLYEQYERHEVIAYFGADADAKILCNGQWVILPGVVLCFAQAGEPPRMSHFTNGGEFCWVADTPYRFSGDEHVKFVPPEVIGPDRPTIRM
jgi:hypothetical protein